MLKKRRTRDEGGRTAYVQQLERPQIYYVEGDRTIFEEAWLLTEAHREDLVSRYAPAVRAVAAPPVLPPPVPRVLAMLRGDG